MVKIIETPRDGFQGLPDFIPTKTKVEYINLLLQCGFDTIEIGSFVSPSVIPQMADTGEVLDRIDFENSKSKIAVLVATKSGGEQAMKYEQINQIFFPFSVSPTFLKKNINQTFEQAENTIDALQNMCVVHGKELIVYFSMGFGRAYGDDWSIELLYYWIKKMRLKGLNVFPFSDILGNAKPDEIKNVFSSLIAKFDDIEFGFHLHTTSYKRYEKIDAAFKTGVRRFDTVINGLGGCPQADNKLVGNLPLDSFVEYCLQNNINLNLNEAYLVFARKHQILRYSRF